jgi:hypothetical protein
MLFKTKFSALIKAKKIHTAIRKWTRPTVKENGTLITAAGQLRIVSVKKINYNEITDHEIIEAGYANRKELDHEINGRSAGEIYRIKFKLEGEDPRIKLREHEDLSGVELDALQKKFEALDARSKVKGWPLRILEAINKEPGMLAIEQAKKLGYEKIWFKFHVRKLKNLGLTISLERGYKISPRGKAFLEKVK